MKTRTHRTIAAATLAVVLIGGRAVPGSAQGTRPASDTTHTHQPAMDHKAGMPAMQGMPGMMGQPHQLLAMAYRDNLATFARALHNDVARTKTVNLDLARPAVAEMRRSFDQMQQHQQAQMSMMSDQMKSSMPDSMKDRQTRLTALGEHLAALEADIQAGVPVPAKVSEHTAEILKLCDGMMKPPGTAKAHPM